MKRLLLVLLSVLIPALGYGEEIFVVTEDYPPYNYKEDGQIVGISTEIVEATLQELGMPYTIRMYPWARAYRKTLDEANTLLYTIGRTPEREHLFQWVGPLATFTYYFYHLAERTDIVIHTIADAKGFSVGAVRDDARAQYLEKAGFQTIDIVANDVQNIKKLLAGRIDLFLESEDSFEYKISQLGIDASRFTKSIQVPELTFDVYMAFGPKTDPAIVKQFNESLNKVKAQKLPNAGE